MGYSSSLLKINGWTGSDLLTGDLAQFSWAAPPDMAGASWAPAKVAAVGSPAVVSATPNQVLYLQEAGTTALISATDINQGQMGDCFLLSSIGELALFHPDWITNMIQANADGTETVTLYRAANGSLPSFGTTSYIATSVTVTNVFPTNSVNNGASQDVLNGQKEIWVQVLEKAAATLCGGYNAIANGGYPTIAMEELTGCVANFYSPASVSLQQLHSAISAGDLITFDTRAASNLPYGMFGSHAYMFNSLSTVNGTVMVNLLNPWGFDNPNPIPLSQITTVCDGIDIDQFVAHQVVNVGPTLALQTAAQTWVQGAHVSLTLPVNTFSELSGKALTYSAAQTNGQALPSWLAFNATTRAFSGTVPAGMETLSLTVTATDTSGLSCGDTFQATVPAAAPKLAHQTAALTWTEGAAVSFTLAANTFTDPNGQALSYAATLANGQGLPSWLSLDSASGAFSGTAAYTSGPMSIKVTATDTSGLSGTETFIATLAAPAPKLTDQTAAQNWTAGSAVSLALPGDTFTAVPGQTLRYSASLPSGLAMEAATGKISGTAPFALGTYTIKVTATQTSGLTALETFQAVVTATAPTVTQIDSQTWAANRAVSFTLPANAFSDPQGETMTYTVSGLPVGLAFNATNRTISGTTVVAPATYAIKVTARDQSGLTASDTFNAVISASAPTVGQTPDQAWAANKAVSFSVAGAFADPQGEKLAYIATLLNGKPLPAGLTFSAATATFGGIAPTALGAVGIKVTATNQSGLSVSETFQAVTSAQAPNAANAVAAQAWAANSVIAFTVPTGTFVDPQGEKLAYVATRADGSALPTGLVFNKATDAFSGTAPITPQTLGLTVTATNQSGLSVSETFSAVVSATAPKLAHQTANQVWTDAQSMHFLMPSGSFVDPQKSALTYTAFETGGSDQTAWLAFNPNLVEFLGTPPAATSGTIGIEVVATNGFGLSVSETFGMTFGAVGAHATAAAPPSASEMIAFHQ